MAMIAVGQVTELQSILDELNARLTQTTNRMEGLNAEVVTELARLARVDKENFDSLNTQSMTNFNTLSSQTAALSKGADYTNDELEKTRTQLRLELGTGGKIAEIEENMKAAFNAAQETVKNLDVQVKTNLEVLETTAIKQGERQAFMETVSAKHDREMKTMGDELNTKTSELQGAVQGAYAAASIASQSNAGGSGGPGQSRFPLDGEKKFDSIEMITGNENLSQIQNWQRRIAIMINSSMMGAGDELAWAETVKERIPTSEIQTRGPIAIRLNQQLYSLLMMKVGGKADAALRTVNPNEGLEGWRVVIAEILKRDKESLHQEWLKCIKPDQIQKSADITSWLNRWDVRLADLQKADSQQYQLYPASKAQILKDALPSDTKTLIQTEQDQGRCIEYEALRQFVVNRSNFLQVRDGGGPPKMALNTNNEQVAAVEYTEEDYNEYVCTVEGHKEYTENPSDPSLSKAVLTMVSRGKGGKIGGKGARPAWNNNAKGQQNKGGGSVGGKAGGGKAQQRGGKAGGGKSAGKGGKGGFKGDCYHCGVFGHSAANCPNWDKPKVVAHIDAGCSFCVLAEPTCGPCDPVACPTEVATVTQQVFIDPLDRKENSWKQPRNPTPAKEVCAMSAASGEGAKLFQILSENEQEFPQLCQALMSMHTERQSFNKPKGKIAAYSADIEKLAREIEKAGMHVKRPSANKNDKFAEKLTSEPLSRKSIILTQAQRQTEPVPMSAKMLEAMPKPNVEVHCIFSESNSAVNAVDKDAASKAATRWVKVPVAMDSGAMVNVAPKKVFGMSIDDTAPRQKLSGPDGKPIAHHGSQKANGVTDDGQSVTIDFDIADVTRPLGSVSKLVKKCYQVIFDDERSYIRNKKTGAEIELREQQGLYFLDMWVEIPHDMAINELFARHVQN